MSAADILTVRQLILDQPQFVQTKVGADGSSPTFRSDLWPLVAGTVNVYRDGALATAGTDYATDLERGLIVFTVSPASGVQVTIEAQSVFFSDTAIQTFLDFRANTEFQITYAAADALDAMASRVAMVQQRLETLDIKTDGPALAKALREHAKSLRATVRQEIEDQKDESTFGVSEEIYTAAGYRTKIWNDWLRTGG